MTNPKFDFVFLGQSVLKYQVPLDIFMIINNRRNDLDYGVLDKNMGCKGVPRSDTYGYSALYVKI